MNRILLSCMAVLAVLAGAGPLLAQEPEIGITRGRTASPVTLEDLEGNPVDLSRWIGHGPVLLEFWATWCPQCARLFPRMEAAHERYGDQVTFLVIAVGVGQSQRSIRRHLERHPMPFTVLWDGSGRAVRAFEAPTTSYVVTLDAAGRVVYTGVGDEQDIMEAVGRVAGSDPSR